MDNSLIVKLHNHRKTLLIFQQLRQRIHNLRKKCCNLIFLPDVKIALMLNNRQIYDRIQIALPKKYTRNPPNIDISDFITFSDKVINLLLY